MPGLDRLLRPRSIAVIGGGIWCANVIEQCRRIGFDGEIWPVHPKRSGVAGLPAFRRIEELPDSPDASFIGINRDDTVAAVGALARCGAGGAVCFASGFREAEAETGDGHALEDMLLEAAGQMPILGPNCYGFLNYLDGVALWPDQHGGTCVERGVAIITQSSNIAINLTMQDRGLPVAYVVTVGNQAQTGLSEVCRALLRDDRVTALGLHIEGIDDLRGFEALADEAHANSKSIVALKVGRSDQAQAATVSHTASLAGTDAGAGALFQRLGIGRACTLPAFLEALKLLHVCGPLASNRIASMSCSGGEASLVADAAHGSALDFPPLDTAQQTELRDILGPRVPLANPLDYHTGIWGNEDALAATFTAVMKGDVALGCVVLDFPRSDRCDTAAWEPVIGGVARTRRATGKPMAIVASLKETLPESTAMRLADMGVVPFAGLPEAIEAMEIGARLGRSRPAPTSLILPVSAEAGRTLTEAEAKALLAAYGLCIPKSACVGSAAEAAAAAEHIGFPVALKGDGIAHKTDAGAVLLSLCNAEAVLAAAQAMPGRRFLVEEMITGAVVELLVGVVADPAHGYVLTLAAGGTLTELMGDHRVSLLIPATREEVSKALLTLKLAPLLSGYRGRPAADLGALLNAIMAVQAYVADARPQEIEINPLMCGPNGAVAADALIRIGG